MPGLIWELTKPLQILSQKADDSMTRELFNEQGQFGTSCTIDFFMRPQETMEPEWRPHVDGFLAAVWDFACGLNIHWFSK